MQYACTLSYPGLMPNRDDIRHIKASNCQSLKSMSLYGKVKMLEKKVNSMQAPSCNQLEVGLFGNDKIKLLEKKVNELLMGQGAQAGLLSHLSEKIQRLDRVAEDMNRHAVSQRTSYIDFEKRIKRLEKDNQTAQQLSLEFRDQLMHFEKDNRSLNNMFMELSRQIKKLQKRIGEQEPKEAVSYQTDDSYQYSEDDA